MKLSPRPLETLAPSTPAARRSVPTLVAAVAALATAAGLGGCGGDAGSGGSARRFVHASFFSVEGSHAGFTCDRCHDPAKPTFSAAGGGVDCLGCHARADVVPMHDGIPGFAYDTPSCIGCHKAGGTPVFDHPFPIAPGTNHERIACSDCHGPTRAKADLRCTACHAHDQASTDAAHAGVANYQYASPSCYDCHPDGTAGLPPNHDAALFPVTGTKHAQVGCGACHGATKKPADVTCVPCHAQAATNAKHTAIPATARLRLNRGTAANYAWATAACLRCHADGQVNRIASHPTVRHGLTGEGHAPFCVTCHDTLRADKPWAANLKAYSCLACHTDNNGGGGD